MVKSKKESLTKVEAASLVSTTKPSKKSKRDAEVDLDIKKKPKKQKKEVIQAEKKAPPPKKVETSSSSSDSEEEVKIKKVTAKKPLSKKDDSSSEDSSSDEEAVTVKKKPAILKKAKAESSSSEDNSSSSDEESVPAKKQPTVVKSVKPAAKDSSSSEDESDEDSDEESEDEKKKEPATKKLPAAAKTKSESSEEDSDDEESDDEKPPTKKAKVSPTKTSKQESSSGESSEEESEDEKVTPKKKDTDVEMAEAEQKSEAKQVKTQTTQRPTTQARGGSTTLFAGNLPFQIEKSDIEDFFKEVGGIVDVRFASDSDGRLKGYGHFEFASVEAAQKALNLNGKQLLGRTIRLSDANAKPAPRSSNADGNFQSNRKGEGSQVKTIFVSRFDKSVAESDMRCALRGHFSDCGEITRISLPCDQETGATRGMAYLDLKEEDGFNKALGLNGSELGGWKILVLEGKPRGWNSDGNNSGDRFTATRPGRGRPGRVPPGRGRPGRPSKPSILASAEGKKIVFDD
ncbi:nucleolin 2 isoform X6 [Brassica napus]|uniref:nucleolin 2 isoform X6 n=1 Tax=Brassica napus TaxID=3708 RepID=UPI0006AAD4DA|nr:nucleolin 2 isoform X6 [Brassica napus]